MMPRQVNVGTAVAVPCARARARTVPRARDVKVYRVYLHGHGVFVVGGGGGGGGASRRACGAPYTILTVRVNGTESRRRVVLRALYGGLVSANRPYWNVRRTVRPPSRR